jgi:ATP-binding cassette subfamily B protein
MTIPGGKTVAILGGTGSGKTTLIQLLQRLHEPQDGSITIGGVDISTVRKSYLRDRVGLVMQEPYLYSKTVAENIAIKQETPNRADVEQAAKIACVHEDICQFSDGYDTVIGERGVTLSGGQKQRTAIARAIISDSDILIFDDALSAVDTKTDSSIRQALKQRREGVTTIIISHRISTLMEADKIFVLSGGTVAEEGTHQELLDMGGIYRRVYDIQAAKEV